MRNSLVVVILTIAMCRADADTISGVDIPDTLDAGSQVLVRNGAGIRSKTIFKVRVYVAALYLNQRTVRPETIIHSEAPRGILLHFLRDVASADLQSSLLIQFRKLPNLSKLEQRVTELCQNLPDMKIGRRIKLIAVDDKLNLYVDDQIRCVLEGKDFCDAVFAIYVGKNPVEPRLRDALLNTGTE